MSKETSHPGIDAYMKPFLGFFHRAESRELAECYVTGLLMDGERKSVEPMSEKVNASERSMQRLLSEIKWNDHGVAAEYRRSMLSATADPLSLLILGDTGFPKKGRDSVCVARQFYVASGKFDNCQIGVSMAYVGQDVAWPYAMSLFIPESWDKVGDDDCDTKRKKTRMPETTSFRPKWRIALDLLDLARKERVPHRAVLADYGYGDSPEFRQELDVRGESYILGIAADTRVFLTSPALDKEPVNDRKRGRLHAGSGTVAINTGPVLLSTLVESIADNAWQQLELRRDSGFNPLRVEAVSLKVWPAPGWRHDNLHEQVWLLIERRQAADGGHELLYFFSNIPQHFPTLDLARLQDERHLAEYAYRQLRQKLGLDHHEGRSWTGWHRHVLLVFLAYGYLTLRRLQEKEQTNLTIRSQWRPAGSALGKAFFS